MSRFYDFLKGHLRMRQVEIANEGAHLAVSFRAPNGTPSTLRIPHAMAGPIGAALLGAAELALLPYHAPSSRSDHHPVVSCIGTEETAWPEEPGERPSIQSSKDCLVTSTFDSLNPAAHSSDIVVPMDATALNNPAALERYLRELESRRAKIDAQIDFLKALLVAHADASSQAHG